MSSADEDWHTPIEQYQYLENLFHFRTDPCATADNSLDTPIFYTEEDDGLIKNWELPAYVNPPYSVCNNSNGKRRRVIDEWVKKSYYESKRGNGITVMLIASRTDVRVIHDICFKHAKVIVLIRGRLKYGHAKNIENSTSISSNSATFPSMIVIFSPEQLQNNILQKLEKLGELHFHVSARQVTHMRNVILVHS